MDDAREQLIAHITKLTKTSVDTERSSDERLASKQSKASSNIEQCSKNIAILSTELKTSPAPLDIMPKLTRAFTKLLNTENPLILKTLEPHTKATNKRDEISRSIDELKCKIDKLEKENEKLNESVSQYEQRIKNRRVKEGITVYETQINKTKIAITKNNKHINVHEDKITELIKELHNQNQKIQEIENSKTYQSAQRYKEKQISDYMNI